MKLICQSVMLYSRAFLKILILMKLIVVFLITVFLQQGYSVTAQGITIAKKNASLHSILKEIRMQSGYDFFFEETSLENAKPVDINIKNGTLDEVLETSFRGQPFTYSVA